MFMVEMDVNGPIFGLPFSSEYNNELIKGNHASINTPYLQNWASEKLGFGHGILFLNHLFRVILKLL